MKNKILLVVMLLLTFFGLAFSGLSSVEVKATTDTVSYDINAINVPRNVISSFPVTYKSVHGNTITWTVQEKQNIITYDEEAHWMVVNRPESGTNSVVFISVTVTDGVNSETKNFEIIVPAGKTAAPKYTITYNNGNDVTTDTYKLGDATKVLPTPEKEGYTFDGWYEGETKVEKILVGSARNYNLVARWTKNATPLSEVEGSLSSSTSEYDGNAVEVEVTLTHENETLVENTHYTVSYTKDGNPANEIRGAGNYKVVVTAKAGSGYAGTKEFDYVVTKATYDMSEVTFEDATHVYDGEEKTLVIGGELPEGVTVSYTTNKLTHVDSVEVTASFTGDSDNYNEIASITKTLTITPATYTLTPGSKQIYVGNALPSWNVNDLEATGRIGNDVINVNSEDLVIEYKNENGEPVVQPSAAGTYKVVVKGLTIDNNDYSLVVNEGALTIIATNFTVSVPEGPYVYNGSAHTPEVVVKDGETVLTKDVDYTVSYDDNTNAGTAKVILTAKGTYAGLVMPEATFTISPKEVTLTANNVEYTYGDQAATNGYTVTSENLSENEINLLKPQVAIVVNAVKVTYTENGNYAVTTVDGTVTMNARDITITASDKSSVYGSKLVELTYTITGHTVSQEDLAELAITLTKAEGTDAGTYEITVTATSNAKYNVTPVKGTYTISQLDLTDEEVSATVLGSDFNVQCENNTPSVEVSYNENVVTTYELSYLNNTAAGTAQVVITYTGNYTGTTTLDFVVTETGQAGIDAAALDSNYSQILTGEITELAALSLTINNSTVFWTPSTTAVKVDPETGVVTILRSTEENLDVELVATVKYGTTSTAVVVFNFVIPANKTLENNSVTVTGPVVDLTFTATEISKEDAAQSNYQIVASEEYVSGYDIEFNDGEVSSFDTPLTVKLPIPNEYVNNPNIKLYHVLENGELEAVDAQIIDGYFVFEASKFSPYIIVVEKTYTVTFKNEGVAMGEAQIVKHGLGANAPELPTREGYTTSWDKAFNNVTSDLEVNVVYTANTYKLTVNVDGQLTEYPFEYGATITGIEEPEKVGYTFSGWDPALPATMPANDLEVTATWTINTYTVTFKNGEEVLGEVQVVQHGQPATAPALPLKSGYNASWDTEFDNVTSDLVVNVEYKEVEEISIAEFLTKEVNANVYYKLTGTISNVANTTYGNFDLTDGTGTVYVYGLTATQVVSNDKSFSSLGIGAEYVVTLIGIRAEHNGNPQVGAGNVPAYYVSHVAPTYSVTVTTEGNGEATLNKNSVTGGSTVVLTVTPDSGYKVSSIKANNSVVALEDGNIYEIEINANTEITVVFVEESQQVVETLSGTITFDDKAKRTSYSTEQQVWEESGITVTNDKATSTTSVGDYANPLRMYAKSTLKVAINGNIQAIIFDCEGLEPKYVSPISGLDGAIVDGNIIRFELNGENEYTFAPFSAQARVNSITVEYTASNTPTYTVTFDSNEGSAVSSKQVAEGGKITKPSDPIKEGYTFDGWYTDKDLTIEWDFEQDTVQENITLYANWTINSYTLTYDLNGGTGESITSVTKEYGGTIILASIEGVVNEGYIFNGWKVGSETKQPGDEITLLSDITAYAQWMLEGGGDVTPKETTYQIDLITNFSTYAKAWGNGYGSKTLTKSEFGGDSPATVVLSNASKQTGTITNQPVMASAGSAQYVTLSVDSGTITNVKFNLTQWSSKTFGDIHIEYFDGTSWIACSGVITTPKDIESNDIPDGVTKVRLSIYKSGSKNVQVGIAGIEYTIVE